MTTYDTIEQTIRKHIHSLKLDEGITSNEVFQTIRQILRDNPDIFWFAHKVHYDENDRMLTFQYLFSLERINQLKKSIDDVITNDFNINYVRSLSQIEQVMYVYKWIISYCNYNINSAFNQEIDSVFVRRNSVCTGYAKAAQYLFSLLDIESQLVFGQLNNSLYRDSRHCWNIVKINDEYYHIDICLGDIANIGLLSAVGVNDTIYHNGCYFNFFAISTQEISQTRSIEDVQHLPSCENTINRYEVERYASSTTIHKRAGNIGCLLSDIGSSADIHLCSTDKRTVLKVFRNNNNTECRKEHDYMKQLVGCQHLIELNEKETDLDRNILGIEQSTPILDLFFSRNFEFGITSLLKMVRDIGSAWQECKSNGVIYRDIHLCNIYRSDKGIYKLGDFGSCTTDNRNERVGNIWFMSPKTYIHGVYDEHCAIYSITMVLYFILNDLHPAFWQTCNENEAIKQRLAGRALPIPKLLLNLPRQIAFPLLDFISKGYQSEKYYLNINDYVHSIYDVIQFYSKYNIKLSFNYREHLFLEYDLSTTDTGTPANLQELSDIDEETSTIIEVQGNSMQSTSNTNLVTIKDISNTNKNVDDIESYCRTQGFPIINDKTIPSLSSSGVHCEPKQGYGSQTIDVIERSCTTMEGRNYASETNIPIVSYKPKYDNFNADGPIGSILKKIFWPKQKNQFVLSSVFAPAEVKRASHMLVQVYLHLPKESESVQALAQETDKNAKRRDYIPLQCKLKKGDKVDVLLNIYGETLMMSEKKSVVWQGSFTKCSFDFFVPKDINVDELSCMAMLSVNGTPVGEMRFITTVVEKPRQLNPEIFSKQYQKIFISYAHQDEPKVEQMARAYKAQGVEYFFDRHYLQPGDIFPIKIREFIDSADLFILCWSANAANSDYVDLERKRALERAYPKIKPIEKAPLRIYPMSIEPRAELPSDMRDTYNFEII